MNKIFKFIITLFVLITFTVLVLSCKEEIKEVEEDEVGDVAENDEVVIDSPEIKPVEEPAVDSALEAILKEKVSFISEALPGAELNTKTGELTAKVGNEWGIKEGEFIGWYVVKAFKMETADGVEEEQDAIGLISPVIEAMQNKIFEETKEYYFPIILDLRNKGIKMRDLTIIEGPDKGFKTIAVSINSKINFYAPHTGEWRFFDLEGKDKFIYTVIDIGEIDRVGSVSISFTSGTEITADMKKVDEIINGETGEIMGDVKSANIELGQTLGIIENNSFLDETDNRDYYVFDNPGNYQLNIFLIGKDREICGIDRLLEVGSGNNKEKIFILPNETAHEQTK